jgi:N-acetylmuramoyl-L-alanine amidase
MVKIIKKYITKNDCYKTGRTIVPKGIIVHSTATPQSDAMVYYRSWNRPNFQIAVHAFLDANKIVQLLPWEMRCWGCASGWKGSGNDTHIQFEICEPDGFKYVSGVMTGYDIKKQTPYFNKVWDNAIDLCVYLCKKYNLTEKNIIDHQEAYRRGIASNHSDTSHWFPLHQKNMDLFRAEVKERLHEPTFDEALKGVTYLAKLDYGYWKNKAKIDKYFPDLIKKIYTILKKKK